MRIRDESDSGQERRRGAHSGGAETRRNWDGIPVHNAGRLQYWRGWGLRFPKVLIDSFRRHTEILLGGTTKTMKPRPCPPYSRELSSRPVRIRAAYPVGTDDVYRQSDVGFDVARCEGMLTDKGLQTPQS